MRRSLNLTLVFMILMFLSFQITSAQAPNTVLYQGKLTNAEGTPLTAVDSVTFIIGTSSSGISIVLYDTTVYDLAIDNNGVFTVELGPISGSVFNGSKRYLGIRVNADAEMSPRQVITSGPYAFAAQNIPDNSVNSAKVINNTLLDEDILDEPGAAHSFNSGDVDLTSISIPVAIDSVILNIPAAGYITLQTTGSMGVSHPGTFIVNLSLSTSNTAFDYDNQCYINMAGLNAGTSYIPFYSTMAFTASTAGTYRFYLMGYMDGSTTSARVFRSHIVAAYYPTAYGTVDISKSNTIGPEPEDVINTGNE